MSKTFKWTVTFEVDPEWVADGFNLTAARSLEMLANELPFAHYSDLDARVVKAPSRDSIAKCQGYTGADDPKFTE